MPEEVAAWLARLERWVGLHPVAGGRGHAKLADELARALSGLGLSVARHSHPSGDLLVARGMGAGPLLGIYGHYDVEPGGRTDLLVTGGRVFGRGVGDDLGPLALRLSVLERFGGHPNLLWVIEPGEEDGSRALSDWVRTHGAPLVDLWLDETGYFDVGGTQRILAIGAVDRADGALRQCRELAAATGRETRVEVRRLRRVAADAEYRVEELFASAPYLALGPNDDRSDVHGPTESLPLDTIELSMRQFGALLEVCSGKRRS